MSRRRTWRRYVAQKAHTARYGRRRGYDARKTIDLSGERKELTDRQAAWGCILLIAFVVMIFAFLMIGRGPLPFVGPQRDTVAWLV